MKYDETMAFDDWADMVYEYEYNAAVQKVSKGADVDTVVADMAKRIQHKMSHPVAHAIREAAREVTQREIDSAPKSQYNIV
jgi:glutamyl-tRNA reductase